jgi:hypothetical protein
MTVLGRFVSGRLIFKISGTFLEQVVHWHTLEQVFQCITENFAGKLRHHSILYLLTFAPANFYAN